MTESEKELYQLLQRIIEEEKFIENCEKENADFESKINLRNLSINEAKNKIREIRGVLNRKRLMPNA
jgi:hypothetical protein